MPPYISYWEKANVIEYSIPILGSKAINTDIMLDMDQIDGLVSMLNSRDKEDIELAVGIVSNIRYQMGYEVLIWKLMNYSHNWALDGECKVLKRLIFK